MKQIQENPYRIAGILSNSTEKELQKQKSKITRYVSIGKKIDSELDFSVLKPVERSEKAINKAFSSMEQNHDKVMYSLFWFLKTNTFDETALNHLINGDKEKAMEIWEKVTHEKEVTDKNFSCLNNLGTLKLLGESEAEIKEGIDAKVKLIESACFKNFIREVADETYIADSSKQIESIINELLPYLKQMFSDAGTIRLFSNCNSTVKKMVSQKFTEDPLHQIENRIEKTKKLRREDKAGIYEAGKNLMAESQEDLKLLKSILGENDLTYKMIADTLAKEVMQCGIDYFQAFKETKDPSKEGLELLGFARSITLNPQTKERIKENIAGIEEWAKMAPVKAELDFILQKIASFQRITNSIQNAKELVNTCKPKLQSMKNKLGATNDFYLNISSGIANNAQGMLIEVVNKAQNDFQFEVIYNRNGAIEKLKTLIRDSISASLVIGTLDMTAEVRTRYNSNDSTLRSIAGQLGVQAPTSASGGGCYIATMVYGDYEHPQVLELRRFRDEYLSHTVWGSRFISFYYAYSPLLVRKWKDKKTLNRMIRIVLDQFIQIIK